MNQFSQNPWHIVQFSHSVVSDSLRPHEPQHARPPCPSPTPGVYSNSCPSSRWCHPAISSSIIPFSSCPQSLPASRSFPMNQLFAWGGQSTGVSVSASVLPVNTQDWSPLGMDWLDLLAVQGTLKSLLQHHSSKASIFWRSAFFTVQLSHPYMTTGTCPQSEKFRPADTYFITRKDVQDVSKMIRGCYTVCTVWFYFCIPSRRLSVL